MGFFDFLKVDPTINDPVVAQASGISRDNKGIIHQKRTASSDRLASNLVPIAGAALAPVLWNAFVPSVEYSPIASKIPSRGVDGVINMGGKVQPLLGMSKSLPSVRGATNLAVRGANTGKNWTKGIAGTLALGTAVGQGASEPSQKKRNVSKGVLQQKPKYAIGKYNQKSYNQLVKLQKQHGGDLIRQKDGSYFLKNTNGSFYGNGRALNAKTGKMQNYDLWGSGKFINTSKSNQSSTDIVNKVTDKNYLYGYVGRSPQSRINNSAEGQRIMAWQKRLGVKADGWWGKNTAAAYNTWKSKQSKQAQQSKPVQGTPGYGIHVGNNGVTLQTPNGQTTDITNSHNVSTLINNGNYKAPNLGILSTNQLDTTPLSNYQELSKHNFNRADIRQGMRDNGFNPYSYSGSDRKQLRTYLNNPTTDNYTQSVSKIVGDGKVQQNMLNNAVQNQTDKYQLTKPQLVNLKFKQGGQMYKYQQGGQASGQQGMEQQAIALVQAAMQGDQQANQTIQQIMQAAQQGDQQALQVAQLLQAIIQKMKGSRKARLGAKLNYIRQSIGECPEGQEVVYFKKGGEICKVCQEKKMQNGGKQDAVSAFKKKKEQDKVKESQQINSYTRGRSAKEIAEMQKKNRQEASQGKGESPANVAPWRYKKK